MSNQEAQEEEKEVLLSIYDSDECFKQQSDTSFTYRVGEPGTSDSFLVEVTWGESYPDELPTISLEAFYNKHLTNASKEAIIAALLQEAEALLGSPLTYSLFEFAKEHSVDLVVPAPVIEEKAKESVVAECSPGARKKEKKEHLSKAAKRKMADRMNAKGERPRGWDWVDIVKLSKTGSNPPT